MWGPAYIKITAAATSTLTVTGTTTANDLADGDRIRIVKDPTATGFPDVPCAIQGLYTVGSAYTATGTSITIDETLVPATMDGSDKCAIQKADAFTPLGNRISLSGYIYRIRFQGNPGKLKQPEIITHLDGKRNSLMSTKYALNADDAGLRDATEYGHDGLPTESNLVITKVWTDGQQGEDNDYFADHCDGVTVTVQHANIVPEQVLTTGYSGSQLYADGNIANKAKWTLLADATETSLLKKCLGDSDMTSTNNVEIHNWDKGSPDFPHLIKLVRTVTSITDGGYYVAIYWDDTNSEFVMLNPFTPPDALETDVYEVYTTQGTLARVSAKAQAYFGFGQKKVITTNTFRAGVEAGWDGDVSCETGANGVHASRLAFAGDNEAA